MENFIIEEIDNILNNTESETYCKLTDKDIQQIIDNTKDSIMSDNEMNNVITDTIKWYIDHYIYNSELINKIEK